MIEAALVAMTEETALTLDGEVRTIVTMGDSLALRLGAVLRMMRDRRGWAALGYEDFDGYLEARFQRKRRWAQYQIATADKLDALPTLAAALGTLGPTKVRLLAEIATPENEADLLARYEGQSVRQIEQVVDDERHRARQAGEVEVMERLTFMLAPGQAATVRAALGIMAAMADSDKPGHLLEMMAAEVLATYDADHHADAIIGAVGRFIAGTGRGPEVVVKSLLAAGWGVAQAPQQKGEPRGWHITPPAAG